MPLTRARPRGSSPRSRYRLPSVPVRLADGLYVGGQGQGGSRVLVTCARIVRFAPATARAHRGRQPRCRFPGRTGTPPPPRNRRRRDRRRAGIPAVPSGMSSPWESRDGRCSGVGILNCSRGAVRSGGSWSGDPDGNSPNHRGDHIVPAISSIVFRRTAEPIPPIRLRIGRTKGRTRTPVRVSFCIVGTDERDDCCSPISASDAPRPDRRYRSVPGTSTDKNPGTFGERANCY